MIQNYDFQDEMKNLVNFTYFEKIIFIQQWLTKNMWSIGEIICIFNNKLQQISFKNSFMWKKTKKDSQSFCKVIMLVLIYVLTPWNTKSGYNFGTKNFVNKRTYKTLSVFSRNWNKKRSVDMGFVK
jgi:hypothetical protein